MPANEFHKSLAESILLVFAYAVSVGKRVEVGGLECCNRP